MNTRKALRCVIINRVSSETQRDGASLETQDIENRAYIERMGGVVAASFNEVVSGSFYYMRSELQRALEFIEAGHADALVTFDLSRYSRHGLYQRVMLERLQRCGGRLLCSTLPLEYDDDGELTPESGMMFGNSGNFAEYLRRKIHADTRRGRKGFLERGVQVNTRSPWGYHIWTRFDIIRGECREDQRGKYVLRDRLASGPNPREMTIHQVIRALFALADPQGGFDDLRGGQSVRGMTRWLFQNGLASPRGSAEWTFKTLTVMLANPVYRGQAVANRLRTQRDERRVMEKGLKLPYASVLRPEDQWIYLSCPPLVEEDQWQRVRHHLTTGRDNRSGNPRSMKLLTGLLLCPNCGRKMISEAMSGKRNVHYYACRLNRPSRTLDGRVCNGKLYPMAVVDASVLQVMERLVSDAPFLSSVLNSQSEAGRLEDEQFAGQRSVIETRMREIELEEGVVLEAQIAGMQGGARSEIYVRRLGELAKKRDDLESQLKKLRGSTPLPVALEPSRVAGVLRDVTLALSISEISTADRRHLLAMVIESVVPSVDEEGQLQIEVRLHS